MLLGRVKRRALLELAAAAILLAEAAIVGACAWLFWRLALWLVG